MAKSVVEAGAQEVEGSLAEAPRTAEQALGRAVIRGVVVAVPIGIAVFMGLVALAVGGKNPNWGAWLGMAGAVGLLGGTFFGVMSGFLRTAPLFAEHGPGTHSPTK